MMIIFHGRKSVFLKKLSTRSLERSLRASRLILFGRRILLLSPSVQCPVLVYLFINHSKIQFSFIER